jgi:hypothetical protein
MHLRQGHLVARHSSITKMEISSFVFICRVYMRHLAQVTALDVEDSTQDDDADDKQTTSHEAGCDASGRRGTMVLRPGLDITTASWWSHSSSPGFGRCQHPAAAFQHHFGPVFQQ